MHNPYYSKEWIDKAVCNNNHRNAVGGLWEELGKLQMDFLIAQRLTPQNTLLDIGCGALRLGVKAIDYLQPGNYYGQDISKALINAGYEKELNEAQRKKQPKSQLIANDDFDFSSIPANTIDIAIAQSLFSHLPLNHIRRCLTMLVPAMRPGGVFFATYWHCADDYNITQPLKHPCPEIKSETITTYDIHDSYHYRPSDFNWCIQGLSWRIERVDEWKHPRGQQMLAFHI